MHARRANRPIETGPNPSLMRNRRPRVFPNDVDATDGQTVITVVSLTDGGETPAIDCIAINRTCLGGKTPVVPGLHRNGPAIGGKSFPQKTTARERTTAGEQQHGHATGQQHAHLTKRAQKKTHRGFGSPGGSRSMTAPKGSGSFAFDRFPRHADLFLRHNPAEQKLRESRSSPQFFEPSTPRHRKLTFHNDAQCWAAPRFRRIKERYPLERR